MSDDTKGGHLSPEAQVFLERNAYSARHTRRLAEIESQGSLASDASSQNVRVTLPGGSMKYNSFTDTFTDAKGATVTPAEMNKRLDNSPVQRIPDDGRDTNAERQRLTARLNFLKGQLEEVTGYDAAGTPIYKLAGMDREKVERAFKGESESIGFAFDELDALDAQRRQDDTFRAAQADQDEEREARLEREARAEADRIEIRTRAERIIAARRRVSW